MSCVIPCALSCVSPCGLSCDDLYCLSRDGPCFFFHIGPYLVLVFVSYWSLLLLTQSFCYPGNWIRRGPRDGLRPHLHFP